MPWTYAVPDLHGRFDLLEKALNAISVYDAEGRGKIVFLGDYVDRGPDSRKVIERLIAGPNDMMTWIALKGNHEDMMETACHRRGHDPLTFWIVNGGHQTLSSYGKTDVKGVPEAHLNWVSKLSLMHIDKHRVFVHAWVNPQLPLDAQDEQRLLWKRFADSDEFGHDNRHIVHGHHIYEDGPLRKTGRTGLDTGAWYTGRLVIGVFDDELPGGPIDIIEVTGPAQAKGALRISQFRV